MLVQVRVKPWGLSTKLTLLMSTPAGVWYFATVTATAEPSLSSTSVCRQPNNKPGVWN